MSTQSSFGAFSKRALGLAAAAGLVLAAPALAGDQICYRFDFPLTGVEEVPPVVTPATGTGVVQVVTNSNEFRFEIAYDNLSSTENAAHLHGPAVIGKEAGPIFSLPPESPKIGVILYAEEWQDDLLAGLTYVNIHTVNNGAGEIRGQVDQPTSCDLFNDDFEDGFTGWSDCVGDGCPT